jgi:DNA invertase Pin-like site-specific DNA recombinase
VLIEDASRFARKLLTQELGIIALAERGVHVVTASGDDLTATDDEMKVPMRQIAGAFAQLEKSRLVRKLREARERKRAVVGKCEGRKSHAELRPDMVALARQLRRKPGKSACSRSGGTAGHCSPRLGRARTVTRLSIRSRTAVSKSSTRLMSL